MPVVPLRDPPPLFTWEVFPNVYPPTPPPVRSAEHAGRAPVLAFLIAGCLGLAALAGLLAFEGADALSPGPFTIAGEVFGESGSGAVAPIPLAGALVSVQAEGASPRMATTDAAGQFAIPGVGPGGVTLNVSHPGYYPGAFSLFVSAIYSTAGTASDRAVIDLEPLSTNGTVPAFGPAPGPFSDLEGLIANVWSSAALLALGLVVAAAALVALVHRRRPALVVVGGAAAAVAPVSVFQLGVSTVVPITGLLAAVTAIVGVSAVAFQAIHLALEGHALEPE
jgi:Carboxypeptidase regulatory-like domain